MLCFLLFTKLQSNPSKATPSFLSFEKSNNDYLFLFISLFILTHLGKKIPHFTYIEKKTQRNLYSYIVVILVFFSLSPLNCAITCVIYVIAYIFSDILYSVIGFHLYKKIKSNDMDSSAVYLTTEQLDKLRRILKPVIPIYPSPATATFPTIHVTPKDFLRQVLFKLKEHSIDISAIRLHGSAASYVLIDDSDFLYRDIDISFHIQTPLSSQQKTTLFSSNNQPYLCDVWTIIKYIVSSCLIEHTLKTSTCTQYFVSSVLDAYTKKNIQISSEQDSWALLSLQNLLGRNLELKFVENLKRHWLFSVDSFEIDIKPILLEKNNPSSITTKIQTKDLLINAINGITIIKKSSTEKNQDEQQSSTPGPLEFGFFTPSTSPEFITEHEHNSYSTLATITTIERTKARSISPKISSTQSNQDDEEARSSTTTNDIDDENQSELQFHISINEDVDDGIEADVGDSTNEDDEQAYQTPTDSEFIPPSTLKPIVQVYSFYKDLHQALSHLNNKIIATYEPETIRGGGLLKYCDLLARNYKLYDVAIMTHMQRYMCSRFFIDYKTLREQLHVIAQYVSTHYLPSSVTSHGYTNNSSESVEFSAALHHRVMTTRLRADNKIDQFDLLNASLCLQFFEHLLIIIQQSTVCLTHEDRDLLLYNLHVLKECYHFEYDPILIHDNQHYQKYHVYTNSSHYCSNTSTNSSRSVRQFRRS